MKSLLQRAEENATHGTEAYKAFFSALTNDERKQLAGEHDRLKAVAAAADQADAA